MVPDYSVGFYYFADCFFVEIQTIRLRQLLLMILLADTMKVFSWLNWFIFISLSIRGLRRSEGFPNRQANTCETKCFSTRLHSSKKYASTWQKQDISGCFWRKRKTEKEERERFWRSPQYCSGICWHSQVITTMNKLCSKVQSPDPYLIFCTNVSQDLTMSTATVHTYLAQTWIWFFEVINALEISLWCWRLGIYQRTLMSRGSRVTPQRQVPGFL